MYYDTENNTSGGQGNDERIARLLSSIEQNLRDLRQLVLRPGYQAAMPAGFMPARQVLEDAGVEGIFDGERMVDTNGKSYPVPPNYASKSKLVEGDPLKMYATPDGKYVFKQLGPVERRTIPGTLRLEGNRYLVDADEGQCYSILTACVTYYMALYSVKPGDRVSIMIPAEQQANWAVIDNVL